MTNREYLEKIVELLEQKVDVEQEQGKNIFRFVYEFLIRA